MENRLGCKLFDRLGRTIMPTAEAEQLYPRAVNLLEDMHRMVEEITAGKNTVAGELVIGASTIPGVYILPSLAARFKEQYPEISFEILVNSSSKTADSIAENEIFIGVIGTDVSSSKLSSVPLLKDHLVLAASPKTNYHDIETLEQLYTLPFITRERGSGTRRTTEALLGMKEINFSKFNVCATLGSSAAVKEAVKANLGVSIISRLAIKDELEHGSIKELAVPGLCMERYFHIITAARRTLPVRYQAFLDFLKEEID